MNWCDVDITWILHLYIVCNESAQRSVESNKSLDSNSTEFQWSSWRRHMCFPRPAQSNTFLRGTSTFGQRQDSMKTTRKEYRNITSISKSALHDKATRHPCLSEFQRISHRALEIPKSPILKRSCTMKRLETRTMTLMNGADFQMWDVKDLKVKLFVVENRLVESHVNPFRLTCAFKEETDSSQFSKP